MNSSGNIARILLCQSITKLLTLFVVGTLFVAWCTVDCRLGNKRIRQGNSSDPMSLFSSGQPEALSRHISAKHTHQLWGHGGLGHLGWGERDTGRREAGPQHLSRATPVSCGRHMVWRMSRTSAGTQPILSASGCRRN
jgi:hypothetical protein